MNCPNCGSKINENQKFCSNCGTNLNRDVDNNSWFSKNLNIVIISSLLGLLFICGSVIALNTNKPVQADDVANAQENIINEEETNNTNYIEDTNEIEKPTNLPRKCIYETKDGVCFTTKAFKPDSLDYYACTGGLTTYDKTEYSTAEYNNMGIKTCYYHKDYWAGAMKMCNDWGYKLPNKYELTSLAHDIYGVIVSDEMQIESYLPDGHQLNRDIMVKLGIGEKANYINGFWEDEQTNNKANIRYFYDNFTKRLNEPRNWNSYQGAMCVYNPYGKVKISQEEYERQRQQKLKEKQQKEEMQMKNEAENALF